MQHVLGFRVLVHSQVLSLPTTHPPMSRLDVTPAIITVRNSGSTASAAPVNTNDGFVGFDSEKLKTAGTSTILPPVWDAGEELHVHMVVVALMIACSRRTILVFGPYIIPSSTKDRHIYVSDSCSGQTMEEKIGEEGKCQRRTETKRFSRWVEHIGNTIASLKRVPRLSKSVCSTPVYILIPAGTEDNNELCTHIPGPACASTTGNIEAGPGEGYVHIHRGVHGDDTDDLPAATYTWLNPAAEVFIGRPTLL